MSHESWLRTEPTNGISHHDAEICLNCWYFADDTGVVLRLAAKAYALTGTDEEKLAVLKSLSATDHLTARHAKVPDRFTLATDGQKFRGAVPATVMQENAIPYFDDLIEKLINELPQNIHAINDQPRAFRMMLAELFLWISTCVYEAQDGSLVARVSK
jgi:hypothetical protein